MNNYVINNETRGSDNFHPVSNQKYISGGYAIMATNIIPSINSDSQITKKCTKCGEEKPATTEFFHAQKIGLYGVRSVCKICRTKHNAEHYKSGTVKKKEPAPIITLERLKELLDYNPETGIFIRRITTSNRSPKGTKAGRNNGNGYLRIMIDSYTDYAHRLAWFYVNGELPKGEIDHIDGNPRNNRIANLREATPAQNSQNTSLRKTNKSGATGVSWLNSYQKWEAYICVNYKKIGLGYFDDLQEARNAYLKAKRELHSFQPTPREKRNDKS